MSALALAAGVGLAGAAGTITRWRVTTSLTTRGWAAARATLAVNVAGTVLLGALLILAGGRTPAWLLVLGTGYCGALTTFSSWALHTAERLRARRR